MKSVKTKAHTYTVVLKPFREKGKTGYTVTVPALPGCVTWGRDWNHALSMAEDCVCGFVEALVKAGQPVPIEKSAGPKPLRVALRIPAEIMA